jgi:hypothetical protein
MRHRSGSVTLHPIKKLNRQDAKNAKAKRIEVGRGWKSLRTTNTTFKREILRGIFMVFRGRVVVCGMGLIGLF